MRICRATCCKRRRVFESSSLRERLCWARWLHTGALAVSPFFSLAGTTAIMANSFRRLFVWEAAIELAVRIIALSDRLVARRRFAIADQLVRAAISVPSNIAEGQGRSTTRDRRHYLVQARGSLYELETQLEIASRAKLAKDMSGVHVLIKQISAGLTRMIDALHPSTTRRPDDSKATKQSS